MVVFSTVLSVCWFIGLAILGANLNWAYLGLVSASISSLVLFTNRGMGQEHLIGGA